MMTMLNCIVAAVISVAGQSTGGAEAIATLKIYLPREAVVESERIDLGAVGIIRGEDSAVRRASQVAVGKFSTAGQQMVIDRTTVLAMLASAGMNAGEVVISGAESVAVRRNEDVIESERIVAVAQEFVREHLKDPTASITPITRPKPWVIQKTAGDVRLAARAHAYSTPSRPRVWVDVLAGDTIQATLEIAFGVEYRHRRVVAAADIAEGEVIDANNVCIETTAASYPPSAESAPPFGMIAKRAVRKGTTIRENMIGPETPPAVIKRRQVVLVKVETTLLLVSSFGEAMDDGKTGDLIRVKVNGGRDAKIIVARVQNDGSVSPVT